jgi:hypothetical protein
MREKQRGSAYVWIEVGIECDVEKKCTKVDTFSSKSFALSSFSKPRVVIFTTGSPSFPSMTEPFFFRFAWFLPLFTILSQFFVCPSTKWNARLKCFEDFKN